MEDSAAARIQRKWHEWRSRHRSSGQCRSVRRIWNAWLSFRNRRHFRYLKNLVNFSNAGDTFLLLRAVNPGEANLVDAASGLYVRFRLGGSSFPPSVYYKVFTSRSVCDVNSFAPKDYTAAPRGDAAARRQPQPVALRVGRTAVAAHLSAETVRSLDEAGPCGWYLRDDANGWRRIHSDNLEYPNPPELFGASSGRGPAGTAPVVRSVRREDRERAFKEKKRAWFRRLYKEGMARERGSPSTQPESKFAQVDFDGDSWEEDCGDLLEWSASLDFEGYVSNWARLGTSEV